jgi:hypothetical protein
MRTQERLWVLWHPHGGCTSATLCVDDTFGAEIQFTRDGYLYAGRRFATCAESVAFAATVRRELEHDGWIVIETETSESAAVERQQLIERLIRSEHLFSTYRETERIDWAVTAIGREAVEVYMFIDGHLFYRHRFPTRTLALQWAEQECEALEHARRSAGSPSEEVWQAALSASRKEPAPADG